MVKKLLLVASIIYTIALTTASLITLSGVPSLGSSFDDKIYHLLAYLVLALLWSLYFKLAIKKYSWVRILLSLIMFGVVLELFQHRINPNRTYDTYDLLANCLGVILGTLIVTVVNVNKLN